MTYEEFENIYCSICGSQRCYGVNDVDFREGCEHYRYEFYDNEDNNEIQIARVMQ